MKHRFLVEVVLGDDDERQRTQPEIDSERSRLLNTLRAALVYSTASEAIAAACRATTTMRVCEDGLDRQLPFTLVYRHDANQTLSGRVEAGPSGLDIYFDGYGVAEGENGPPVYIELERRSPGLGVTPILRVWDDIQDPEPNFTISLAGAQEVYRPADEDG